MKKIFFTCLSILFFTSALQAQNWSELGTGDNALYACSYKNIYNICIGPSGNVYTVAYDTLLNGPYIYKWNGTSWINIGGQNAQSYNGEIFALCSDSSGNIYVGGEFTNQTGENYIAKWDGTSWSQVGNPMPEDVSSLCFDKHGNMYAAFSGYAAKLVGNTWVELGTGANALNPNSGLNTICVDTNDNVYVAGDFTDGAVVQNGNLYVAKWNGSSWSELGNGVCAQWDGQDNHIFSIIADPQGNIYVGGVLHYGNVQGGSQYQYYGVLRWNGITWDVLNYGSNVDQFCLDPIGNVYAPLIDTLTGTGYIGKWNGTSWDELGNGSDVLCANGTGAFTIASDAYSNIYAAGTFTDTTVTYSIDTSVYGYTDVPYGHPCYVAKYTNPATGIAPVEETTGITVYPNPTKDEVNITTQSSGVTYRLLNVTGVSLQSGSLQQGNNSLSMSGYSSGLYILEMKGSNGAVKVMRVVKE